MKSANELLGGIQRVITDREEIQDHTGLFEEDEGHEFPVALFLYKNESWIEVRRDGQFYTMVYNDEFMSTDLSKVEIFLAINFGEELGIEQEEIDRLIMEAKNESTIL